MDNKKREGKMMEIEMDEDMDLNIQEDDSENEEIPLPPPRKPKSTVVAPVASSSSASLPPPKKTQTVIKKDLTTVPGQKQKSQPQKSTSSVVAQRTRSNSTLETDEHVDTDSSFSLQAVKNIGTNAAAVPTAEKPSAVTLKRTRRFGPEDDPMQFHARPQELSRYISDTPPIHHEPFFSVVCSLSSVCTTTTYVLLYNL